MQIKGILSLYAEAIPEKTLVCPGPTVVNTKAALCVILDQPSAI